MNQLIRCKNCDEIFMKTPFDQYPEYEFDSTRSIESVRSIERDDFQDFLIHHHGHRLENLKIIEDSFASEKDYFEPVKISYFKATNGKENFVIRKFRERIDEPLKYELVPGDYSLKCIRLEIQTEEIVKELGREFKDAPLPQNKIAAFLKLYQHISDNIDIQNLERVVEECSNPLEIYYKMDDLSLAYLLRNCRNIFNKQEYLNIEAFIHRHKDDGVLLLKATYRIQITERAKAKKRPISAHFFMEKKKAVEKV
jgi:hypothetical protein